MILTGTEIRRQVELGRIQIDPFRPEQCTTNSYDLELGDELVEYLDEVIDPRRPASVRRLQIPADGYVMAADSFLLGHSRERLGSDHFVPIIHGRSTTARIGLFVHVTADLIDIGSHGNVTFQLRSTLSLRLTAGMPLAQVSFWVPRGEISLYKGKYQNSSGAVPSRIHQSLAGSLERPEDAE